MSSRIPEIQRLTSTLRFLMIKYSRESFYRTFFGLALCCIASVVNAADDSRPNILIIFTDDQGYADLGCFGNTKNKTPRLDQLAEEGTRFTSFYAQSVCGPSRSALLTGRYPDLSKGWGMPADEITFGELLKDAGYQTACVGKWDVSNRKEILPRMPLAQGFDYFFGALGANDHGVVTLHDGNKNVGDTKDMASLTRLYTDKAIDYLENGRDPAKPFVLYLSHTMMHTNIDASPEFKGKSAGGLYGDVVEEFDHETGRLLDTLDEQKLRDNTLVIYTTDNGPWCQSKYYEAKMGLPEGSPRKKDALWYLPQDTVFWGDPGPLRGGKGSAYEAGSRVPCIVRWPGKVPAAKVSDSLWATIDFLPTFASLAGAKTPVDRPIDGINQTNLITGKTDKGRKTFVYSHSGSGLPGIRNQKWKLLLPDRQPKKKHRYLMDFGTNDFELYDLSKDIGEQSNVAAEHPKVVQQLTDQLNTLRKNRKEKPDPIPENPASANPMSANTVSAKVRPDVLFIAIDDMNDWTTLFDANNPIQTPNLKRLAKRGCFFTHAYCTTPACNPSRTAILTGLRPTTSGLYGNRQSWSKMMPDVVTLPQHFSQNGYATKGAGKIFHHGGAGRDRADNPSFHDFQPLKQTGKKAEINHNGYVKADNKYLAGNGFDWGELDVQRQTDEFTVEYVNEVLAKHPRGKPLFLAAGIFRPHLPFYAPSDTFARYPFGQTRMPPMPDGDLDDVPPIGKKMAHTQHFVWEHTTVPPIDRPGSLQKMVQSYQASADYADQMVGRVLDQLEATGRVDNTIIVLWSDHGYHLGDKQSCMKFTLWEKSVHVPLIVVAPGVTTPDTRCDHPVSLVDIYPTLVQLSGLPEKEELDGNSLVPLLKTPGMDWDAPAITTLGRGNHSIRSQRWRYIRYSDGTEELYDHKNDPWEHTNLAGDDKFKSVIEEHKSWLPKNEAPFTAKGRQSWVFGSWDK